METFPLPRSIFQPPTTPPTTPRAPADLGDARAALPSPDPARGAVEDCQINWLEMARFAAEGEGHRDLTRGIRRLATLAAAAHRFAVGRPATDAHPGPAVDPRILAAAGGRA